LHLAYVNFLASLFSQPYLSNDQAVGMVVRHPYVCLKQIYCG